MNHEILKYMRMESWEVKTFRWGDDFQAASTLTCISADAEEPKAGAQHLSFKPLDVRAYQSGRP
jgi:hypothetical protein